MKLYQFLDKNTGSTEITLFLIVAAGLLLNYQGKAYGTVVIIVGFILLAVLYLLISIRSTSRLKRIKSERQIGLAGYLILSVLVLGIILMLNTWAFAPIVVHAAMLSAIVLILIIQVRKFKMGVISHPTTLLLYRLIIYWVISFVVFYFQPYIVNSSI